MLSSHSFPLRILNRKFANELYRKFRLVQQLRPKFRIWFAVTNEMFLSRAFSQKIKTSPFYVSWFQTEEQVKTICLEGFEEGQEEKEEKNFEGGRGVASNVP